MNKKCRWAQRDHSHNRKKLSREEKKVKNSGRENSSIMNERCRRAQRDHSRDEENLHGKKRK
jgi:hypothetical protein